jgi:hypothetical protein
LVCGRCRSLGRSYWMGPLYLSPCSTRPMLWLARLKFTGALKSAGRPPLGCWERCLSSSGSCLFVVPPARLRLEAGSTDPELHALCAAAALW